MTIVKRRKLQYGHVSRASGLAKAILQGTVKGGRRQGRAVENRAKNGENWLRNHPWCLNDPHG